jgi:anti-anti-sigma factor
MSGGDDFDPPGFSVAVTGQCKRMVVEPHGELDLATAPMLTERVKEALAGADGNIDEIAVQLADVAFIDLAGVRALWTCRELARERGADLVLAGARRQARILLELCSLAGWLDGAG